MIISTKAFTALKGLKNIPATKEDFTEDFIKMMQRQSAIKDPANQQTKKDTPVPIDLGVAPAILNPKRREKITEIEGFDEMWTESGIDPSDTTEE